jgi:hypothetical protein
MTYGKKKKKVRKLHFFLAVRRKISYIYIMITIKQNPNFTKFFQVFAFGQYIDEVERKSKAVRIATKLAKQSKLEFINIDGLVRKV